MYIGLGGTSLDDPDDPFVILGAALDQPLLAGQISKERREDLQLWGALEAMGASGTIRHPLGTSIGEDPPDRYLMHSSRTWGTELTELTIQDVRRDLAPVRRFGRDLQGRLRARDADFAHLKGHLVTLTKLDDSPMPRDSSQLLAGLEVTLASDNGFAGEGMDLSQGPPQQLGTRGMYGECGGFSVVVNPGAGNQDIVVSTFTPTRVKRSEAIAALNARVADKDKAGNELLLVTCGLVDEKGYTCPVDQFIFQFLHEASVSGISILPQKPIHIKGVLIHLWNSPYLCHWESGHDVPWLT